MAVFSSPLSQENRIQIARSSFSSSSIVGGGSLNISPVVNTVPQQDPETLKLLEDNQSSLINITSGIQGIQNSVNLLNDSLNLSKSDKSLDEWIKNNNSSFISKDLLIDDSVPLAFEFFEDFYNARRKALKQRFIERVYIQSDHQDSNSRDLEIGEFDDLEVDDDNLLIA